MSSLRDIVDEIAREEGSEDISFIDEVEDEDDNEYDRSIIDGK